MSFTLQAPLRWIAFDAVGTLIFPEPSVAEVYSAIGRSYGSGLQVDQVRSRFRKAFAAHERDHRTSEEHEFLFWKAVVRDVLGTVTDEGACFTELYEHFGRSSSWRVDQSTRQVIAQLQADGFEVAIASNFDARLHAVLDGDPLLKQIRTRLISSEVGWRKPSQEFYRELINRCGVPANEILMVGDDYENDYLGAIASGLSAVLLSEKDVEHDISRITHLTQLLLLVGSQS